MLARAGRASVTSYVFLFIGRFLADVAAEQGAKWEGL